MYTAGIDPGKKGGLAMIRDGELVDLQRMPLCPKQPTGLDLKWLRGWVHDWRMMSADEGHRRTFWLEHASAAPVEGRRQGGQGMLNYGAGWGAIIGITLAETGCLPHLVWPQTWKLAMLGRGKHTKADSIGLAQMFHPAADLMPGRCTKPQDGLAEAILIAEYGARKMGGD